MTFKVIANMKALQMRPLNLRVTHLQGQSQCY